MLFATVLLSLSFLFLTPILQGMHAVFAYILYAAFALLLPFIGKKSLPKVMQKTSSLPLPETVALRELRKQFQEKSEVLHQTRKSLFHLEGEHFILQRKKEEQENDDFFLNSWRKDIDILVQQNEILEEENRMLQEMIAETLAKTPPQRNFFLPEGEEEFNFSFF